MTIDVMDGYWPGIWPGEDGGPRRRQAPGAHPNAPDGAAAAGLRLATDGGTLQAHSRQLFMGCMTIRRGPGEVYLQGCTMTPPDTTGWVERLDPESLEPTHRSPELPGGPFWAGGVAAHANGDLYVTYGRFCHRLDPECGVVAARELPRDRAYNSLLVLPDGHLVMKDFAGGTGPHALPGGMAGSELVVLEPEGLEIVARHELDEGSIARLSADVDADGTAFVVVVGDTHLLRLRWDATTATLTEDETFRTRYRTLDGQTFGWDVVLDGGSAWFLDDGEGTTAFGPSFAGKGTNTAPLHLVRVPFGPGGASEATTGGEAREAVLTEICGRPGGLIANPPAVDAERGIAVGYDSGNGVLAGFRFDPADATVPLERVWTRDQHHAGHLVRFPATGELVSYDFDHDAGTDQVVVLDIESGEELGRVATDSPVQCVVFPSVGDDRDLYVTTFTTVTHLTVG